jgi:hypothetical protein
MGFLAACVRASEPPRQREYDYVIVGAGACGAVIGSGLANRGFRTLVLETGPDVHADPLTQVRWYCIGWPRAPRPSFLLNQDVMTRMLMMIMMLMIMIIIMIIIMT